MKTVVYGFKPKKEGYTVFATKSCPSRRRPSRRSSSSFGSAALTMMASAFFKGLRGRK